MPPFRPLKVQPVQGNPLEKDFEVNVEPKDFRWSVEPVIKWMFFLGIPSPFDGSTCRFARHFYHIFSFMLLLLIQSSLLIHTLRNAKTVAASYMGGISTVTLSWNLISENVNFAAYTIGSQISFLVIGQSDAWVDLIDSFKQLDENLPSSHIYPKCRNLAIKIFFGITSLVLCWETILLLDVTSNDITWLRKFMDLSGVFTTIYPSTQLVLFCILARILSLQLGAIRKGIEDQLSSPFPAGALLVEKQYSQLIVLRRHHRLVCNSIRKINSCFGIFLTLEVVFIFVAFINCSLFILISGISNDVLLGLVNAIVCLNCVAHLFLLTSFSDDIISQSDKVFEALVEMNYQKPSLQYEVALFKEQLSHMKSNINAMGFFDVRKHLFPSLIGTTLTYFLILLQFQSAEKTGS